MNHAEVIGRYPSWSWAGSKLIHIIFVGIIYFTQRDAGKLAIATLVLLFLTFPASFSTRFLLLLCLRFLAHPMDFGLHARRWRLVIAHLSQLYEQRKSSKRGFESHV